MYHQALSVLFPRAVNQAAGFKEGLSHPWAILCKAAWSAASTGEEKKWDLQSSVKDENYHQKTLLSTMTSSK